MLCLYIRIPNGKQPRFPKKPVIHQEGDVLVMECELEANPVPEINWFHTTKLISDSERIKMSKKSVGKDLFLLRLEITNPTREDGGNYRCNACNIYGESNANISLNFQGSYAPFPPKNVCIQLHATPNQILHLCLLLIHYT